MELCLSEGHTFQNLDLAAPRNKAHQDLWRRVDIRNSSGLTAAIVHFQPTHLVHLAARTDLHETRDLEGYAANIEGVRNLIDACAGLPNLQRVVFASSLLVCRNGYRPRNDTDYCPTTLYGESKVAGEVLVRNSRYLHARWVIIRPTSIWGPWFGEPYRNFSLAVARGRYWHPGAGNIPKALGYVGNTAHQILRLHQAKDSEVCGRTFYLADEPSYSIREWAGMLQQTLEAPLLREAPLWLMKWAARWGDFMQLLGWNDVPLTSFRLQNMLTASSFDLKELTAITGQLPFSLQEGVRRTVDWLRAAGHLKENPAGKTSRESLS